MRKKIGLFFCVVLTICSTACAQSSLTLEKGSFHIVLAESENAPVRLAVETMCKDIEKVLGFRPEIMNAMAADTQQTEIVVINANIEETVADIHSLRQLDGFESHRVYVDKGENRIYLYGKDMRGTIYAIYTFCEEILGVPPLWYFASWQPKVKKKIEVPGNYDFFQKSPQVRYRAWFPNDQDLFVPWRKLSKDNNERWLETMLRLKLNTVELETTVVYPNYEMNDEAHLLQKYGLVLTAHHHTALNNSLHNWDGYWREVRGVDNPPKLSIAREEDLKSFWRYNIETVHRANIECLWLISFRGKGDQPFWAAFDDAPRNDDVRGRVISKMLQIELDLIKEITGEENPHVRMTFYDELSDLLANGYITPPVGENILWTYVAARRDHYPNVDLVTFDAAKTPVKLGYYMNLQFTSTGAHLAPAEGPWKMEYNYRYVNSKAPLEFSVVNAGNIREFIFSMSANAKMMWDLEAYNTDRWMKDFCAQYFGKKYANEVAKLYHDYFYAYWQQKPSDFQDMERQYVFQDLRYARAFDQILAKFNKEFTPNPLNDIGFERVKNRTFRLERNNQVDSLISGMQLVAPRFSEVANRCEKIMGKLPQNDCIFFRDNLYEPCRYMENLSYSLLHFVIAYKKKGAGETYTESLRQAIEYFQKAWNALKSTQEGVFSTWYDNDTIFGLERKLNGMKRELKKAIS